MNIQIPVIKIIVHKANQFDTVFIFTGIRLPDGSYLQIQINVPPGQGENWTWLNLKTTNYEIVFEGFEVAAPS